jgi:hypothetical protein
VAGGWHLHRRLSRKAGDFGKSDEYPNMSSYHACGALREREMFGNRDEAGHDIKFTSCRVQLPKNSIASNIGYRAYRGLICFV